MKRSDERNEGEGGGGGEWGGHLCKPLWTFVRENESLEPKTRTLALSSNSTKYAHDILLVSFFFGGEGGEDGENCHCAHFVYADAKDCGPLDN